MEEVRQQRARAQRAALASVQVGDIVEGSVVTVGDGGAVVDLGGGAVALLPPNQMSAEQRDDACGVLWEAERVKVSSACVLYQPYGSLAPSRCSWTCR